MGKRTTIVLSSSSDDDDNEKEDKDFVTVISSNCEYTKSKSKSISRLASSVPPKTNPKRLKTTRLSNSSSRPPPPKSTIQPNPFDQIKLFCEEFGEGFPGLNVKAGHRRSNKESWVDKYKPCSLEDLAVHKKKVEEVRVWLEARLRTVKDEFCNHVLLMTGQAGVGKSATLHVVASHLGAAVFEWNTPTPTLWQEHIHTSRSGLRYTSKLDEFESFVEKIRKYGMISLSSNGDSQKPMILLIDDLPVISGKIAHGRVQHCLHLLVQSVSIPTVILVTDYGKADTADYTTRCWDDLQNSLQKAGTCKVAFNPITANSIKKTLAKICREEQCKISADQIDAIANASGGDIRHAITSLQYFCLKANPTHSLPNDGISLPFGRDETLSLFHALGKFLHNKRESQNTIASDKEATLIKERFRRSPLKMDAPEKVLVQAHGQARSITDFLHENVLDFVEEEAIDDASVVCSYLSDTDTLLASLNGMVSRNYGDENTVQSTAASVAVRGVLFGNHHPLSSRWHAVRRPMLWQVEQSQWHNKQEMVRERCNAYYNGLNLADMSVIATDSKPSLKWLNSRASSTETLDVVDDETFYQLCSDNIDKMVISDDEIEDW